MTVATFIGNYNDPASIGSTLRRRRLQPLLQLIDQVHAAKGECSILDLGGTERYWKIVGGPSLARRRCRITLLNRTAPPPANPDLFIAAAGDGCAVDAADMSFDIVHSNSVIEHVGNWARTVAFSAEVKRLAPRYFVQTPNFWFPWEPHFGLPFFQMLPIQTRAALLMRRGRGFYRKCASLWDAMEAVEEIRLLDHRMMSTLFPEARIVRERLIGMTKSLIAIRD